MAKQNSFVQPLEIVLCFVCSCPLNYVDDHFLESTSVLPSIVYVLLMLATILQAASFYSSWHDKRPGIFYLNLPAKTIEEFAVLILFTLLLFLPVASFVLFGHPIC